MALSFSVAGVLPLLCVFVQMMEMEVKKKQQNVVMASECPVGLYGRKHTVMKELFIFW